MPKRYHFIALIAITISIALYGLISNVNSNANSNAEEKEYQKGSSLIFPAMANIPYMNSIFVSIGDRGLQIASEENLTTKVEKSASDKGITLTINEVYSAGQEISISYTIQSKEKLISPSKQDSFQILEKSDISINGEWINSSNTVRHQKITENKYIGVTEIQTGQQLPDHLDLKFNADSIFGQAGQWTIKFPVKKSMDEKILVAKSKSYKEFTLTAKSMSLNSAEISISFDFANEVAIKENAILAGRKQIGFNLLTDDGTLLKLLDLNGYSSQDDLKGDTFVMHNAYSFLPPKHETDYLILSPYLIPDYNQKHIEKVLKSDKLPMKLDQGELGKATITKVRYKDNKTLLYYKVDSEFPYPNHLDGSRLFLKNASGEYINRVKRYPRHRKGNLYVQEFKSVDEKDKPLKVIAQKHPMPKILEDLQIKIPLND